jgi:hypothetical protein
VDVIFSSSDAVRLTSQRSTGAGEVGMEIARKLLGYRSGSVLGGENQVKKNLGE